MSRKVAIAYVPVLHKGYFDFFANLKSSGVSELYLISDEILASHEELDYINRKDRLRALPEQLMCEILGTVVDLDISLLTKDVVENIGNKGVEIFLPKEDVSTFVVRTYFPQARTEYIEIFLRWNKENIGEDKEPEDIYLAKTDGFEKDIFDKVMIEAEKSFDWWRQVAAALVKNKEIISIVHNEHMPDEQVPNVFGDTRALFKKGININYVTAAHAEAAAIADAAKRGISTEGASLYVTDFPCPYCARVIAKSGIKKMYFLKGYAVLDGDKFLKEAAVEIVKVKI